MKKIGFFLFLLPCFCYSQTPKEIIDKYIRAIGGRENIEKIKDYTEKRRQTTKTLDSLDNPVDYKVEHVIFKKTPNKFLTLFNTISNATIESERTVFDGKTLKMYNSKGVPQLQDTVNLGIEDIFAYYIDSHIVPEIYYEELGLHLTLLGVEKVNDKKAYKIEVNFKGVKWYEYYEKDSGLKVRRSYIYNKHNVLNLGYLDYQVFSGVKFATNVNVEKGKPIKFQNIYINTGIQDFFFEIK